VNDKIMDDKTTVTVDAPALVCDLSDAQDTAEERMAEYVRLFNQALVGRDRSERTVRLRFRADDGVQDWVADLARREKACCPFYNFAVTADDGEVRWDISLVDGAAEDEHTARTMLDGYYHAPDYAADGVAGMTRWLAGEGFGVTTTESGLVMQFDQTAADTTGAAAGAAAVDEARSGA
jgi:hypothetical protein